MQIKELIHALCDNTVNWNVNILYLNHSSIHSCMHSLTYPSIHPFIHPFSHSCMHSFMHSFIHAFIISFIYPFIHSFIHACIHYFIHLSIHSFIYSCIHSFCSFKVCSHWICLTNIVKCVIFCCDRGESQDTSRWAGAVRLHMWCEYFIFVRLLTLFSLTLLSLGSVA